MNEKHNKMAIFSEIMDNKKPVAIKPPKSGTAPRALPELTVLTGNQRVLHKTQTDINNPAQSGKKTNENLLTPDSGDSFKMMNPTLGFDPSKSTWAEEMERGEDASLLDSSAEEAESPSQSKGKGKGKKGKRGGGEKGKEPAKKKAKTGLTWADVAKHHICLITSADLDKLLDHEDYLHIQEEVMRVLEETLVEDWTPFRAAKSGVREGVLQLAIETGEGIDWYEANVPSFLPKKEGEPGFRFYRPGKRPFQAYKVVVSKPETADNLPRFVDRLKRFNSFLRGGYLSASKISTTKTLAVIRLRVGEELMEALAKEDFRVCYGIGSITLQPLGSGVAAEESPEDMEC